MAEEYCEGPNWWDSSPNNTRTTRFDGGSGGGGSSSTSSTTTLANTTSGGTAGYGWLTETSTTDTKLDASSLQLMGLGLSNSPPMEWNQQHMLRNPEKTENSFRTMLQEGMSLSPNFQQDTGGDGRGGGGGGVIFSNSQLHQWRPEKLFPTNEDSSEFKQIGGRGFTLDHQQSQFSQSCSSMESSVSCNNHGFQLDSSSSSSVYGSPSSILQELMGHDQQNNHQHQLNYGATSNSPTNNYQPNYFGMPPFLKASSPKQQQQQQQQLHFMNNAPYWNNLGASGVNMNEVRPNFFSLQAPPQLFLPTFEEKPKTTMETRDTSSVMKTSTSQETNNTKRARNDGASSPLPPFKVRKEKMGDRITALQQLVSPFGKTDTASVLSEAIEYIKFLHEQVSVLSNPYLKSGAPYQQQPCNEKVKIDLDGPKQDLRSRGLCLVPVSSTFPVTHETTVDFWTPTFGGTFR